MALSKSTRISIMLGIDIAFFLVELISGFMVGSLALMADAFHMLNDIISLMVGLWAVAVARKESTDKYSFGWLRAEILGAFFNAVFLIALCVSIILEALTRFLDPPVISNPVLILVVGCFGLTSNLVGFVVLGGHDHGHSHDDHEHEGHEHGHDDVHQAEEGHGGIPIRGAEIADESGPAADVLPDVAIARATAGSPDQSRRIKFDDESHSNSEAVIDRCGSRMSTMSRSRDRRRTGSMRHSRLTSIENISIHPASFRQDIIAVSLSNIEDDNGTSESEPDEHLFMETYSHATEQTPLLQNGSSNTNGRRRRNSDAKPQRRESGLHNDHHHSKPKNGGKKSSGSHGHSHGDMGMNAMVLHVLGDALGNLGVIVTALVIWLTDWPGKYYADPAVSLLITVIILRSALPLTFATAKVLLQATPDHIDVKDIREDIERLPGVLSCHHVHIWQLSDTKVVASMHIQVAFPISDGGGERYMELARRARKCLHAYGIHSATIQPEFCLDRSHAHRPGALGGGGAPGLDGTGDACAAKFRAACTQGGHVCLLECVDDCFGQGCCSGPGSGAAGSVAGSAHSSHSECSPERRP